MTRPSKTSRLLQQVQAGEDPDQHLVEVFEQQLRSRASQLIGPKLRRRIGASDIVIQAIKSALSDLQHGKMTVTSAEEYRSVLYAYMMNKFRHELRRHTAARRTVKAEEAVSEAPEREVPDMDGLAIAIVKDAEKLLYNQESPRNAEIIALHFGEGLEPKDIQDVLREFHPEQMVPAIRTIQLILQRALQRVAQVLSEDKQLRTSAE